VKPAQNRGRAAAGSHRDAFTLVELLVVIVIIALVAALLLPALSRAKASAKQSGCLGNLRQLEAAFQMYASDNGGYLIQNVLFIPAPEEPFSTNAWVYGDMMNKNDATNVMLIKIGELFPYVPQPATYHCPADLIDGRGPPRVRSYSMNSWIGSKEMEVEEEETPFRIFLKDSDVAAGRPASIWVLMDEHTATLDDGWFEVTMDDSQPFLNLPATRHQNAYGLNFADGHAEIYHLRTAVTQIAETQAQAFTQPSYESIPAGNTDWIKLKGVTTSP